MKKYFIIFAVLLFYSNAFPSISAKDSICIDSKFQIIVIGDSLYIRNLVDDDSVLISESNTGDFIASDFGDSLENYEGFGINITDNSNISVDSSEIATVYDVSLKLNLTTFGDSLTNYDGYGINITDNDAINADTSQLATQFDISSKYDAYSDLPTAAVTDNDVTHIPNCDNVYEFTKSNIDTIRESINWYLDTPVSALSDTLWLFMNLSGKSLTIIETDIQSDLQNAQATIIECDEAGGNIQTIDALTASSSGVNFYYYQDSSPSHATIETRHRLGIPRPSSNANGISLHIKYYYLKGL